MSVKSSVLNILEKSKGEPQSGAKMAKELGISRNAVWKTVNALKEEGFLIESSRAGYRYRGGDSVLSVELISSLLGDTLPEAEVRVQEETDSTNDLAKREAALGAPHGAVFLADRQTGGKGRLGRSFFSPPGKSVYLSILLKRDFPRSGTMVTLAAAVAVCEAVERLTEAKPQIKWVNDIFLGGRKLCGILTEASMNFETADFEYMVVGIGVNANHLAEEFPPELSAVATSLRAELGHEVSRSRLAAEIIRSFFRLYQTIDSPGFIGQYRSRCFVPGRDICVLETGKEPRAARALEIDEEGRLLVEFSDGERRALSSGEISIRTV